MRVIGSGCSKPLSSSPSPSPTSPAVPPRSSCGLMLNMLGLGFVSYRPLDRSPWHKTKRPGLGLSHKALSRSALPQVLLNHRIGPQLFRVNGTAVPDDITLRPYCDSPPCLNFVSAGGGALRRAVTAQGSRVHAFAASPTRTS